MGTLDNLKRMETWRNDDHLQGAMTVKLLATMMLSVDGMYLGPGGPDEDRRGGFERGGWTAAHADDETWSFLTPDGMARQTVHRPAAQGVFPDVRHWVIDQRPDDVARLVIDFLDEGPGTQASAESRNA
jgi:hypothetical protein